MKKKQSILLLLFVFILISNIILAQTNVKRLYKKWQPTSLELAKKNASEDEKKFSNAMASQMSFDFINANELQIFVPMLNKAVVYDWKFLDDAKTIIQAIEKNPTFVESPVKWALKIIKLTRKELILEDLADEKKGNIWNLVPISTKK